MTRNKTSRSVFYIDFLDVILVFLPTSYCTISEETIGSAFRFKAQLYTAKCTNTMRAAHLFSTHPRKPITKTEC